MSLIFFVCPFILSRYMYIRATERVMCKYQNMNMASNKASQSTSDVPGWPYLSLKGGNLICKSQILPSTMHQICIGPIQALAQSCNLSLESGCFLPAITFCPLNCQSAGSQLLLQRATISSCLHQLCLQWTCNLHQLSIQTSVWFFKIVHFHTVHYCSSWITLIWIWMKPCFTTKVGAHFQKHSLQRLSLFNMKFFILCLCIHV